MTATVEAQVPTQEALPAKLEAHRGRFDLLLSEPAVLVAMMAALALFYMGPGVASVAVGLAAFFALNVYRPQFALAIVPLAAPLFYRPRVITSSFYVSLAEAIIVCGVAAWAVRDGWMLLRTRKLPDVRWLMRDPGIWLALALGMIGTLWLLVPPDWEHRKIALREYRWTVIEPLFFFAMMLRWLRTERDVWRVVGAWLIAAALLGREGVQQYVFGETWSMEGVGRVMSIYPSATAFGIYMGRALPLALVLAIFLPARWRAWRIAAGLLAVPMALGVALSFARGAWAGVFVAMLVVGLLTFDRRVLVGLGLAIVAGLVALPFVGVDRFKSIFDWSTPDNTGVSRVKIWSAALRILADHPVTGIGEDQFLYADPKYEVPNVRFLTVSHPHDVLLNFWLNLGLPGLVWVITAVSYFGWRALRLWRGLRGTELGALVLGLLASLVDFAVHGLLDMAYFTMDLALTFWLTVGLVMVVSRLDITKGGPGDELKNN